MIYLPLPKFSLIDSPRPSNNKVVTSHLQKKKKKSHDYMHVVYFIYNSDVKTQQI